MNCRSPKIARCFEAGPTTATLPSLRSCLSPATVADGPHSVHHLACTRSRDFFR